MIGIRIVAVGMRMVWGLFSHELHERGDFVAVVSCQLLVVSAAQVIGIQLVVVGMGRAQLAW